MEDFTRQQFPFEIGNEVNINNRQPTTVTVRFGFTNGSRVTVSLPPTGVVTFVSQGDITSVDVDINVDGPLGPRRIE